jgi:hypothetical protein
MKLKCPRCGYSKRFSVGVTAKCIYYNDDDAYKYFVDIEPQQDYISKTVQCCECGHKGTYTEFEYHKPEIDQTLLDEFKAAWTNMKCTHYKVGDTFHAFGVKYKVHRGADCEECAFFNSGCDINPAIPSCNNNIHFEIVKED